MSDTEPQLALNERMLVALMDAGEGQPLHEASSAAVDAVAALLLGYAPPGKGPEALVLAATMLVERAGRRG